MDQSHKMSRYARQEMLPEVGKDGQAKLAATHALVVGAGGLAAPVLQYLVGAGIGRITLIDPDTVALSNLHRQTLFSVDDIDTPKAHASAQRMTALNPDCALVPINEALTPANAPGLVAQADIVLDCADSFAASYTLSDVCHAQKTPLISASVLGFTGYVGGFCASAPSLRAVFPELPDRAANCATAGVMGPVVGTLGAMQAQMAMNTIFRLTPSPLGQLMTVDMRDFRTSGFRFDSAPEPDALLSFIVPDAIRADDFVLDLRGIDETPHAVTPDALRMDLDTFNNTRPAPQNGQRAILTCRSGLRAWQAARTLRNYWRGDIFLIAMGDPALTPKGPNT